MKNIFLYLVFCLLFVPAFADMITIVNPSFELPGTGKPSFPILGWNATCTNIGGAETGWGPTDGLYTAYMEIGEQIFNLTDHAIASGSTYILTFDMRSTWEASDATIDLYYDNAGSRVKIKSLFVDLPGGTSDMVNYTLKAEPADIPAAAVGKMLGIQITHGTASAGCTGGGGWLGLDNFKLERPILSVVSPADKAILVDRNADLVWTVVNNWPVNVYFGSDPNMPKNPIVVTNQVVTTYDPGLMAYNTQYFWRVEALEPNLAGPKPIVHVGPIWSFTTVPQTPVIKDNPVSQTVTKGTMVTFTVSGLNINGYQWFKNDVEINEATGQTLTIPAAQLSDEGYYHCVASGFGTATSTKARLMVKRLVGWWKLNDNLDDSVAEVEAGAPAHAGTAAAPSFAVAGIDGGAYDFTASNIVIVTDSSEYFNFYPQGMTASVWVKTTSGDWGGILSKQDRGTTWYGWILDHSGTSLVGNFRGATQDMYNDSRVSGVWVLATYVWDPDKQAALLYVNGTGPVVGQGTGTPSMSAMPLVFGAEAQDAQVPFTGQLDDVRIWNYALSPVQIALLYTDFNPGSEVCTVNPQFDIAGPTVDGNGNPIPDCRVNLYDFAVIAGQWLECNIVPTCLP